MDKLYKVVDYEKNDTGIRIPIEAVNSLSNGFYLISVRIWIISPAGEVLLIKRLPNKSGALLWENPGHVISPGFPVVKTIISEVYEKTGIVIDEKNLYFCGDNIDGHFIISTFICKLPNSEAIMCTDAAFDAQFISQADLELDKDIISEEAWRNYLIYKDSIFG